MTAPTMPPVSDEPPASGRPRFALPHGWWRWRPSLDRSSLRPPALQDMRLLRQPWLLGVAAAVWAAAIGLLLAAAPILILWLGSTASETEIGWAQALRWAGLLWLVANGASVSIAGVTITLLPWGLVLIPFVLLLLGAVWAVRRSGAGEPAAVVLVVLPGAVVYAAIAAGVDTLMSEPTARVDVLDAMVGALVVSLLGMTAGALRESGLLARLPIPDPVRVSVRAGGAAAAMLVGLGAVAAAVSLVLGIDDAITMARSLAAGAGGGLGLLLLGLAYVPVLAVWGTAYVLGAGVGVGGGVMLSPFLAANAPAQLPAFPLLAALPQQAPPMAWMLPLLGVVAGVVAGALISRACRAEGRLVRLAIAAGAAVLSGLILAVLAWLSLGSLGTGRLVGLGPDPMILGVLGAVLVSVGAVPTAVAPGPPPRPALAVAVVDEAVVDAAVGEEPAEADPAGVTDAETLAANPGIERELAYPSTDANREDPHE